MFTGIIEITGTVQSIERAEKNITYTIASPISHELKIDQSVSHNGVCLTVVGLNSGTHDVTAIHETLEKSNLGELTVGSIVNLERCTVLGERLDGHMVQGHVDQRGLCEAVRQEGGSWIFTFSYQERPSNLVVEKGSIAVNGISLTVFDVSKNRFSVAIIPYTYEYTNLKDVGTGSTVNLEFDIIGKYVERILGMRE